MQTLKQRAIHAVLNLPDMADIEDIENELRRIVTELKKDTIEPSSFALAEKTLAGSFEELRQICLEENYRLEIPERINRANDFSSDS